MPFAPAADPDLAARLMYAGITEAGRGLAHGLEGYLAKREKRKDDLAQLRKDRSAYMTIAKGMNARGEVDDETLDELHNVDTPTIAGFVLGKQTGAAMEQATTQNKIHAEELKRYQGQSEFNKAYAAGPPELPADQRLTNALTTAPGGIDPAQMLHWSRQGANATPFRIESDPITGKRWGVLGNSIVESGVDPDVAKHNAAATEPQEININGKPSGWALFPDGKYRMKSKGGKDEIDAKKFDTDNDGSLNQAEFNQAILAQSLHGIYPGMKVGPGPAQAAPAAAPSGDWLERFKAWRLKRNSQ